MWNNNNKLPFFFLVFVSIFIILFFARQYFYDITTNLDDLSSVKQELKDKRENQKKLEELSTKIKNSKIESKEKTVSKLIKWKKDLWNTVDLEELKKYTHEIKEDELIDYFYSYVNNSRSWSWYTIINSISFDKWVKNEYGFLEWKIDLSLTLSDETELSKILDFVVNKDSYYKFFIDNFSFPNDKQSWSFTVLIPLKVFYK